MLRRRSCWNNKLRKTGAIATAGSVLRLSQVVPTTNPPRLLPSQPAPRWSGPPEQLQRLLPLEACLSSGNADLELALEPSSDGLYRCTYTGGLGAVWGDGSCGRPVLLHRLAGAGTQAHRHKWHGTACVWAGEHMRSCCIAIGRKTTTCAYSAGTHASLLFGSCSLCAAPDPGFWRLHITSAGQPLPRTPFSVHVADPAAAIEGPAAPGETAAGEAIAAAAAGGASEEASAAPADALSAAAGSAPSALPAQPAPASAPIVDQSRLWEQIAAAAFAADGSMDGWDSDSERQAAKETKEQQYIRVRRVWECALLGWLWLAGFACTAAGCCPRCAVGVGFVRRLCLHASYPFLSLPWLLAPPAVASHLLTLALHHRLLPHRPTPACRQCTP